MIVVMGRPQRIDVDDGWYHVMNRGASHQRTFLCDADRVEFGRLLGVGHERFGVEVHAYCLMSNHFHLLVHCPTGGLSRYMHLLCSSFVRHVNERAGRDGPLFRGRFRSIVVSDDRQLLATVRYIHRNALDLPGVVSVDGYRWSSHRTYLGHRPPPEWLHTNEVLAHFGGDVRRFHEFVDDSTTCRRPAPWGRDGLEVDVIAATVELAVNECSDLLNAAPQGIARTVMILGALQLADDERMAWMTRLGFEDDRAMAAAVRRAERRAMSEPGLQAVIDRVSDLLR